MEDFKKKLYNYKAEPPVEIWDNINAELNKEKQNVIPLAGSLRRKSRFLFYGMTAAASLLIIFVSSLFFNKSGEKQNKTTSAAINDSQSQALLSPKMRDSINLNNKILKEIIESSKDKNLLAQNFENSLLKSKKYLTIAGPEGQPVKISPKVATLIESADNEFPPKPVWNKKIEKWKQIMLSTTLSPTSTNLLDIAQISANENNE